jgi:hypothetical protein
LPVKGSSKPPSQGKVMNPDHSREVPIDDPQPGGIEPPLPPNRTSSNGFWRRPTRTRVPTMRTPTMRTSARTSAVLPAAARCSSPAVALTPAPKFPYSPSRVTGVWRLQKRFDSDPFLPAFPSHVVARLVGRVSIGAATLDILGSRPTPSSQERRRLRLPGPYQLDSDGACDGPGRSPGRVLR